MITNNQSLDYTFYVLMAKNSICELLEIKSQHQCLISLFKIGSERKTCIRVSHWKQQHNMWLARIGPESLTKINRICPNQLTPRHKLLKVWMTYQIKVCFALFLRGKKKELWERGTWRVDGARAENRERR